VILGCEDINIEKEEDFEEAKNIWVIKENGIITYETFNSQ
jgi:hypothetical protein